AQRAASLPGNETAREIRETAITDLRLRGLPSRRVEAWHYTDLRRLLSSVPALEAGRSEARPEPLIDGSAVFAVVDGVAADAAAMPGLSAERLADRLASGDHSMLSGEVAPANVIERLNRGFASDGWLLSLAAGTELDKPVELQILHGGGQTHTRCGF